MIFTDSSCSCQQEEVTQVPPVCFLASFSMVANSHVVHLLDRRKVRFSNARARPLSPCETVCFLHCFERGREKEAASWQSNYGPSITIQSVSRRGGDGPLWVTNQFKEHDNYASIHLFLIFNIFFSSPVSLVPLGASRQAASRAEWLQGCLVFFFFL